VIYAAPLATLAIQQREYRARRPRDGTPLPTGPRALESAEP
jgi:hypothetical protein